MTTVFELLAPFENAPGDVRIAVLCHIASHELTVDPDELNAAVRRAQLLLATGGDPRRPLDLDGRAVRALADDLDAAKRRAALAARLHELAGEVDELPQAAATLARLETDGDLAWRGYAAAILADALADIDS